MTKEEFYGYKVFIERLPVLRIQLSDGPLLDRCQQALLVLLDYVADDFEPHEEYLPPESEPEPKYPEPAHIEEVPKDEDAGRIKDVPQEEKPAPPSQFRHQPEAAPKPVEKLEPEHHRVSHKAPHRKRPHRR